MSTGIYIIDRIIIAIAIEVQTIDGLGVQVGSVIRGDKSSPLGGVVPGVAVIQASVICTIIAIRRKTDALAASSSACLFHHFPHPQSRKSLPG